MKKLFSVILCALFCITLDSCELLTGPPENFPGLPYLLVGTTKVNNNTTLVAEGINFNGYVRGEGTLVKISVSSDSANFATIVNVISDSSVKLDHPIGNGTVQRMYGIFQ